MEAIALELVARLGIDLALITLKNMQGVKTIDEAIAALEKTKTAEEYVLEDAVKRGVPAVPLPDPVPDVPQAPV